MKYFNLNLEGRNFPNNMKILKLGLLQIKGFNPLKLISLEKLPKKNFNASEFSNMGM